MADTNQNKEEEITKMLGANVPDKIYWKFKEVASTRKETMMEAILSAAMLYIEFEPVKDKLLVNK
jgi:negative regulator of replication initiation